MLYKVVSTLSCPLTRVSAQRALTVFHKLTTRCLCLQALELLPSSIEVREVYKFLLNVLKDKEKKRKDCQVLKSLLFAEHLQVGNGLLVGDAVF